MQSPSGQSAFQKARFDYCLAMYEKERDRQLNLEKKSQFYLSFVTLFLGAIFLNLGFLDYLSKIIATKHVLPFLPYVIYGAAIGLGISLLSALLLILGSMRIQKYTNLYPENLSEMLFSESNEYLEKQNLECLFKENALSCAISTESNKKVNDKKSQWVQFTELSLTIGILFLALFISLVFGLSLS